MFIFGGALEKQNITQTDTTQQNILMAKKDTTSFEKKLFKAADKLRKNIDAAEYKHIVLGLVFLKYSSFPPLFF